MYYVLVENNEFRGVLDYKPNIGKDNVEVIEYDGIIPKENMTVFEGKLVDKESLTFINGKFIKRDYELEKQQELNKESRNRLASFKTSGSIGSWYRNIINRGGIS